MIKVCHIISGDLWAGAEAVAYHLLKGLGVYPDLECSVILLNEGKLAALIEQLNIPVYVLDESRMSFLQILRRVREVMGHITPDILHSHRYKENMIAYLVSKKIKDVRLVATHHGMPEHANLKQIAITKLNFILLATCFHNVVAVSENMQQTFVKRYGFSEDKVRIIHNGIPIPQDVPRARDTKIFTIGSAGRLFPVKDYPFMVDVAGEILKRTRGIHFYLAGEGPELEKIRRSIQKYKLDKFFFLRGHVDDVDFFYQGLDLYLNTSLHEGIPLSVLEAMAHRIPVIAPKIGGFQEIIDEGVQGYLIENRNPGDFAGRCMELYENRLKGKQMGKAAREKVVRNFSVEHMAGQYHKIYSGQ